MSLPLWKIRREFRRLGAQLRELPGDLINLVLDTRRYDRTKAGLIRQHAGAQPETDRVVIFLIYPKGGLPASVLRAFDYFSTRGYAVLAVSNISLAEEDRATLLTHCWRYMERPNVGYDFGGYRDAVLSLADRLDRLERLAIFNDSVWFPLPGTRDWLKEIEALGVDFAGASSHFGAPRTDIAKFRDLTWKYSTKGRNFHYGSFALVMRPTILGDPGFLAYWKRLKLAEKKRKTVRRGEIGLTQWVLSQGYSHAATLDISTLDRDLEALPTERLLQIARGLVLPELPKLRALIAEVTSGPAPARSDLVKLILVAVARQGASYALAPYSVPERGFPFIKKSPMWLSDESARNTLALLEALPGVEAIRAEAMALRDQRTAERPPGPMAPDASGAAQG